jgi:hypothetical protein
MSKPPMIGDFRSKPANEERVQPAAGTIADPVKYEEAKTAGIIAEIPVVSEPPTDKMETNKELTPAEEYQKRLKDSKIDLYEARSIIDAILSKGFYEENFKILGRKGVFRSRSYADQLRVNKAIELENPATAPAYNDLIIRHNLAASLVSWDGRTYPVSNDDNIDDKLKMIESLPGPLMNFLSRELSKFDAKMMIVFSDGAVDNF